MTDEMRGSTFDELAKGLATGTVSRRKALRMFGAALVGGTLASIPGFAWAAKPVCPSGVKCKGQCCAEGEICVKGAGGGCTPCPTGQTACNGTCVDTNTDPFNCGSCGNQCGSGQPPCCVQGTCMGPAATGPGDLCICAFGGNGCSPLGETFVCCADNICRETCPA